MPQTKIADPEFAKAVAEAYVNGLTHQEIADIFSVRRETISVWVRDPRVMAHAGKMAQERVLRITRKVDSEMEKRLDEVEEMEPELLLKIRKEYLARTGGTEAAGVTPETVADTVKAVDENPGLAEAIKGLLEGQGK